MTNTTPLLNVPCLHVYAQDCEHAEAFIVGNTNGLKRLRDAIDRALAGAVDTVMPAYTADGEGFDLYVVTEDKPVMWEQLQMPYVHAEWWDKANESRLHPAELILKDLSEDARRQWAEVIEQKNPEGDINVRSKDV